jgi:hypothetical protein
MRAIVRLSFTLGLAAASVCTTAHAGPWVDQAGEARSRFSLWLGFNAEYGGDEVATIFFQNGDDQTVRAGQGISAEVGAVFRPQPEGPFGVRLSFGDKYVTTKASNADININRTYLELLGTYRFGDSWWVGAGPVRHSGIKFNADGLGPDLDFDSASGVVAQAGWRWFALKFTDISYRDQFGNDYDANSVGFSFVTRF